ncbi:ankyrin repeat domain-containing protein [Sporosarcina sp. FSL K6-1508]|uniref:ankyrin repeat domain-containing protein n=1 Tax=Sporosarcina sp. FSL K6-1508 TaxID=2921553 RepID=UPI0030F5EFB4
MRKEPLSDELVRAFIIAAHGDFEEVKKLVEQEPALLHSSMNWGGDDWESGLGAAAHTGNRAIAEWLLERGARMDIFTAAMLGELSIVKAILAIQPNVIGAPGPHGISLLRHAQMGGEPALPVYEYLESLTLREEVKL